MKIKTINKCSFSLAIFVIFLILNSSIIKSNKLTSSIKSKSTVTTNSNSQSSNSIGFLYGNKSSTETNYLSSLNLSSLLKLSKNKVKSKSKAISILNKNNVESQKKINQKSNIIEESIRLSNWLKINSPQFLDASLFPKIVLNDYSTKSLPVSESGYRVNPIYTGKKYSDPKYPPTKEHFYFRYTKDNLYYSTDPDNYLVLENISIKEISRIEQYDDDNDLSDCLKISTIRGIEWNICTEDKQIRHTWFCEMNKDLNIDSEACKQLILEELSDPVVIDKTVTQPIILIPLPSKECNENWNYKNKGQDWECDCIEGKEQSPIDLPFVDLNDFSTSSKDLVFSPVKPVFYYSEIDPKLTQTEVNNYYNNNKDYKNINIKEREFLANTNIKLKYDKNKILIRHPNLGEIITLDGVSYKAEEIVFHTPSEHKIDGKKLDMEVEIIHYAQSKENMTKKLILNILFKRSPGVYNKFIDDIDAFNLPNPLIRERDITNKIHIHKFFYNSDEKGYLEMKDIDFYTYQGSLTSPPCTENTIHIVTAKPMLIGSTVLHLFKEAIKTPDVVDQDGNISLNTNEIRNNRSTQPLNGRRVYFFKTKKNIIEDIDEGSHSQDTLPNGHYEKIKKKMAQYFHVSTDKPSGMPGSFVVSEKEAQGY